MSFLGTKRSIDFKVECHDAEGRLIWTEHAKVDSPPEALETPKEIEPHGGNSNDRE